MRTDVLLGAAQHDALEQAAEGQQALRAGLVLAQYQRAPHIAVVEGLVCQKLQQPLRSPNHSISTLQVSSSLSLLSFSFLGASQACAGYNT